MHRVALEVLDDLTSQDEFELTVGVGERIALGIEEVDITRQDYFAPDSCLLAVSLSVPLDRDRLPATDW